jgi:meso-butanediol dehydrogenase/(S,S)-butanediol dehydrogenase/diacetyl reductase
MGGLLQDQVIFVTGGSTGIGWACAQAYKHEGAHAVIAAEKGGEVEKAAEALGSDHLESCVTLGDGKRSRTQSG